MVRRPDGALIIEKPADSHGEALWEAANADGEHDGLWAAIRSSASDTVIEDAQRAGYKIVRVTVEE